MNYFSVFFFLDIFISFNNLPGSVMTASFHKFGEYFPGTGDVKDKVSLFHFLYLHEINLHVYFNFCSV